MLRDTKEIFPEIIEQPIFWGSNDLFQSIDKYKAIVDKNTGKLFSIVSQNYKPIKHQEAIAQMEKAIENAPDLGRYSVETDFLNSGGRMRRVYRFTDQSIEIRKYDFVNPELQLYNSFDATWPLIVILGAYRRICSNGLVIGQEYFKLKKRHVYELSSLNVREKVHSALKRFTLQGDQWKEWACRPLTPEVADKVILTMSLGPQASVEIENQIIQEASGCNDNGFSIMSLWDFYNVYTWYITHRSVSINHRVELEGRLRRAIKGL